ncbi:DNRLRE domain-containing protein [Brevibacillus porteri]|uniref:DNRLRE domain-containing protein n=1 Tax=Brevibacillus porteri TaxID=2126350 RepID=UPI003D1ABACD
MPTLQHVIGELPNKRTQNSKHYLLSDGSFQAVIFMGDVHYEDEHGNLQNIDTDLYDEADFDVMEFPVSQQKCDAFKARREIVEGAKKKGVLDREKFDFHALRVPFAATISRNFRKGYSVGKGENKLTFKPIGASVSIGRLNDEKRNEIEYQDAWNDVDVKLELTERGVKETLILKTEKAPTSFSFQVEGNIADDLTAGELLLENAWLEDAVGTHRDVQQTVRRENGKVFVDIVADATGLVFPVVVDPTVGVGVSHFKRAVNRYFSDLTTGLKVGTYDEDQSNQSTYSTLLKFDVSSIPLRATVQSAYFEMYHYANAGRAATTDIQVRECLTDWVSSGGYPSVNYTIVASKSIYNNELGWHSWYIDSLVQKWIDGTAVNNGFELSAPSNLTTYDQVKIFYDPNHSDTTLRPKLTIRYNQTPTTPVVISPNGGETWDGQHTISWSASTDPDGDSLRYQIQLTTDGGSTWKDIVALTGWGAASYPYNFANEPETSLAKVRIRAYDGSAYSPWDESNGVFRILHAKAPTQPTNLSPSGGISVNRNTVLRLSWKHNDPNSNDPQSKFDLQWRVVGTTAWNTVTQATPNQFWDAPANTFPRANIEWKVRTYDQGSLVGPFSPQATFRAGDKADNPTIIGPQSPVPIARPVLEWSSFEQSSYQVQTLNTNRTVLWDSGEVASVNKARTIGMDLSNNTSYILRVRIKNVDGLWSDWAERTIMISYTTPPTPILTVIESDSAGKITVRINNPAPTGTEPNVSKNDLYRRIVGQTEWTRIATGIANSGSYDDYAAASGTVYEYMARAYGDNGTVTDTHFYQGSINLTGVWLHCVDAPAVTIRQFILRTSISEEWKSEGALLQFAGRKRPVVEFGESGEGSMKVDLSFLKQEDDREALQNIVKRMTTVCYRDNRGRKMFGVIFALPSTDKFYGYDVSITIDETDYKEDA